MKLPLFRAALKDSRLSTLIYCVVLLLYGMMIMSAFTSLEDASQTLVEGNDLTVTETDDEIEGSKVYNMTWDSKANVRTHVALGMDPGSAVMEQILMMNGTFPKDLSDMNVDWETLMEQLESVPGLKENLSDQGDREPVEPVPADDNGNSLIYMGDGSHVNFVNTQDSDIFMVILVPDDGNISNSTVRGPASLKDLDTISDFDQFLEGNPFVEGFVGDLEVDFTTLEGYLSLEYFSMWPLLFIIFLAVKSAGTVSKHIENRSMDILLATGYSRFRFLNEKMLLIVLNLFLVVLSAWLGLILGIFLIGKPVPVAEVTLTFASSMPMAFAFLGLSLLISTLVDEGGKAIGIVMGVVLGEYILSIVGNLAEWGDWLNYFSLFTYWDSNATMMDMTVDPVHILVPLSIAIVSFIASYMIFKRKEIHA